MVNFDVVCNELSNGVRYVCVYELVNEFIYIHSVKCLSHAKRNSKCACWWLLLVESCCNVIVYVV